MMGLFRLLARLVGLGHARCPSCGAQLQKKPTRKTRCKACGQFIFVRTDPKTRRQFLATEVQAQRVDEEWKSWGEKQREVVYPTLEERRRQEKKNYASLLECADGLPFAQVMTMQDELTCPYCRSLEGAIFPIRSVPVPPHEKCTSERSCMCTIRAMTQLEAEETIQKEPGLWRGT